MAEHTYLHEMRWSVLLQRRQRPEDENQQHGCQSSPTNPLWLPAPSSAHGFHRTPVPKLVHPLLSFPCFVPDPHLPAVAESSLPVMRDSTVRKLPLKCLEREVSSLQAFRPHFQSRAPLKAPHHPLAGESCLPHPQQLTASCCRKPSPDTLVEAQGKGRKRDP